MEDFLGFIRKEIELVEKRKEIGHGGSVQIERVIDLCHPQPKMIWLWGTCTIIRL